MSHRRRNASASPTGAAQKKKAPLARGQVVSLEKTSNRGRRQSSRNRIAFGCRKVTQSGNAAGKKAAGRCRNTACRREIGVIAGSDEVRRCLKRPTAGSRR